MKAPEGDLRLIKDSTGIHPGGHRYFYEVVTTLPVEEGLEFLERTDFLAVSGIYGVVNLHPFESDFEDANENTKLFPMTRDTLESDFIIV